MNKNGAQKAPTAGPSWRQSQNKMSRRCEEDKRSDASTTRCHPKNLFGGFGGWGCLVVIKNLTTDKIDF